MGSLGRAARLTVVTAILSVAAPSVGRAQSFEGARLIGLADSQRGLTSANDSIYINPAGLALGAIYSIEAGYLDDLRGSDRRFNASIVDSQAGPVAGGLAYTYSKRRPDDLTEGDVRLEGHRFDLALATRVADSAAVGVTARYVTFDRKEGDTKDEAGSFDLFTIDAGLQWRLTEGLGLGLAAYNLTNSDRPELPISWGAGLGYQLEAFNIEADVRYNAKIGKARYSAGAGYVIGGSFPIRAGVAYDLANQGLTVAAGLGIAVEGFGLDVGYRQRVDKNRGEGDDSDDRVLGLAARLLFF